MAFYLVPSFSQPIHHRRHYYCPRRRQQQISSDIEDVLGLITLLMDNLEPFNGPTKFSTNKNDEFKFSYDVTGYKPEELKIDVEGRELIINGYHQSENEHEKIEHQFTRKLLIPDYVDLETINGSIDEDKHVLEITGKRLTIKESEKKSIQIGIKKTVDENPSIQQSPDNKKPEEKVETSTTKTEEAK
uniref:SHSP domain-containing protein n=1 Tax=Panagrolaimus sp. JU765 TaxID=591449 RepID=A0AC34R1L5_9BILA